MKRIKGKRLMEIASKYKYIMLRDFKGNIYGVNCGVVSMGKKIKLVSKKTLKLVLFHLSLFLLWNIFQQKHLF